MATTTNQMMAFANHVKREFAFLEAKGFVPAVLAPRKVRYESSRVWIDVEYEPRDGGINVDFGRKYRNEFLSFATYMSVVNKPLADQLIVLVEKEEDALTSASAYARALSEYGDPIVNGADPVFDRMATTLAPMPWE